MSRLSLPPDITASLLRMKTECDAELNRIADWWLGHIERAEGGYHGLIGLDGRPDPSVPVSGVLMTRLVWFFSAAADATGRADLRAAADRSASWLLSTFIDRDHGGIFWSATPDGLPDNTRKQAYAQAFAVYALARHFRVTGAPDSLAAAKSIFTRMEQHFRDPANGGYWEAFARDWSPIGDIRLSEKDAPSPKTMNTHLHVLEAYAELLRATGDEPVRYALRHLIGVFLDRILDSSGTHLHLFMSEAWADESTSISFGHDIEASWLLRDAAVALGDPLLLERTNAACLQLADAVLGSGTGPHGDVFNERHLASGAMDTSRIWWVQAEAIVAFLDACRAGGGTHYASAALRAWAFVQNTIIDLDGEWRSNATLDGTCDPWWAGPWKACYHNGRAMMEASRLVSRLADRG